MSKLVKTLLLASIVLLHIKDASAEESIDVKEGADVILSCRFPSSLLEKESTLYWIRSNRRNHDNVAIGQTAFHQNYRVEYSPAEGLYDLYITNSEYMRDNGRFECRIKEDGTGVELYTKTISLTVLVPPQLPTLSASAAHAVEGQSYQLSCFARGGSPPAQISWVRALDREILEGNHTEGSGSTLGDETESVNVLTLTPSRADDGAEYVCQVWNRALSGTELMEKSMNISVNYFPVVSVGPENPYKVELEHTAEMKCEVDAKPMAASVRWEFSGRFIDTNFRHVIPQVSLEDSGSYFCSADNGLGQGDKEELVLDVQYGPLLEISGELEVEEGETISLSCQATANPKHIGISWYRKSDAGFKQDGPDLKINKSMARDSDEYTCSAFNYIQPTGTERTLRVSNSSVLVNVRHKPGKAFILPEEAIAVAGRSVTLVCQAKPQGYPAPSFRWWKEGRDTDILNTLPEYTIQTVDTGSVGRYYCQPTNQLGQGETASVDLQVYLPPKMTSSPPSNILKREFTSGLQISCSSSAKPKPGLRWFKDGVEISQGDSNLFKVSVTEQGQNVLSTLSFVGEGRTMSNQLTYKDKGDYSCQFENQVGRAETTVELRIEHKPVPAHKYNKVAYDIGEEGTISCVVRAYPEPRFDWTLEDDVLESGRINYYSNVTKLDDDLFKSTLVVSKVRSSSYGLYGCRALNSIGAVSMQINMQSKGAPENPTSLNLVEISAESVSLSWEPGFNGGHEDTEYSIEYTRVEDEKIGTTGCTVFEKCNVTGLNQYTKYSIRVRARNRDGESKWSEPAVFTTLVDTNKIPSPDSIIYEKSSGMVHIKVPPTQLTLVVELQIKQKDEDLWAAHSQTPLQDLNYQIPVSFADPSTLSSDTDTPVSAPLRARLCLQTNITACGPYVNSVVVDTLEGGQPWLVALIVVVTLLGLVAVLIAIKCVCHTRKTGIKSGVRAAKILHPGALQPHNLDQYKAQMFTIAGENQHGTRQYDMSSHQIEQASSNSQSDSANSQEPLWSYQKSPSEGMDLHYPPAALAGYDQYPGYPYIDETPTDPDRYFGHDQEDSSHHRQSVVLSGEYNCSAAMEGSGYSYKGLPDPATYFIHSTSPNIFITESPPDGLQTPNSRARRIVHEVIV